MTATQHPVIRDMLAAVVARQLGVVQCSGASHPNARYASHLVLRTAQLNSVANWIREQAEHSTAELESKLVAEVYKRDPIKNGPKELFKEVEPTVQDSFDNLREKIERHMEELARVIHTKNKIALAEHHGIKAKNEKLPDRDNLVLGASLAEHFSKLSQDFLFKFKSAVRTGIESGDNLSKIVQRITGEGNQFDVKAHEVHIHASEPDLTAAQKRLQVKVRLMDSADTGIDKIIQAAIAEFSNASDDASLEDVRTEKRTGWQWLAVMDDATCEQCQFYDGEKWDEDKDPVDGAPEYPGEPPAHFNCRCSLVPVDLDGEDIPERSFDDYLAGFSRSEKEKAFGKSNLEAYERGDITQSGLIGQQSHLMTLEQFKEA